MNFVNKFGLLRNFDSLASIGLDVELILRFDLNDGSSFGEIDFIELLFSITPQGSEVKVMRPQTSLILPGQRFRLLILLIRKPATHTNSQSPFQKLNSIIFFVDVNHSLEHTFQVNFLELYLDISLKSIGL